jgi:hypothetical protein
MHIEAKIMYMLGKVLCTETNVMYRWDKVKYGTVKADPG